MTSLTNPDRRKVSNVVSESNLIFLVNKDEMRHINNKIKSDCAHFNNNFNDIKKSIVLKVYIKSIDNY